MTNSPLGSRPAKGSSRNAPSRVDNNLQRIQKVLSDAGVASRRAVEEMILEGRITVNGQLVNEIPCFVDPDHDEIRVDSKPVTRRPGQRIYFLLNKPRGVVCTDYDPAGRLRAIDLVPAKEMGRRVYCVGRLEEASTGLLILTNDGELTQHLTHPRYGIEKTYVADVDGRVEENAINTLKHGLFVDGRRTRGAHVKVLRRDFSASTLEIRISEGPNRYVRRMLARLGHKVRRLKRVAIGPITDRGIKVGHFRLLSPREVAVLWKSGQRASDL